MKNRNIQRRKTRKIRIKNKIGQSKGRIRASVFRSSKYLYGQLIDDAQGRTVTSVGITDMEKNSAKPKAKAAFVLGVHLAEKAVKKGIREIIFDRNGYRFHGRVKAFAEGLREGGLKF